MSFWWDSGAPRSLIRHWSERSGNEDLCGPRAAGGAGVADQGGQKGRDDRASIKYAGKLAAKLGLKPRDNLLVSLLVLLIY
jgi:hypothetical protein